MGDTNAGGGGRGGDGGDLTAAFPERDEPERAPKVNMEFEAAAFTDEQARQDKARIAQLESERAAPKVQGMDYTIGGTTEQEVHENVEDAREEEIRELQARVARQRARSRGRGLGQV